MERCLIETPCAAQENLQIWEIYWTQESVTISNGNSVQRIGIIPRGASAASSNRTRLFQCELIRVTRIISSTHRTTSRTKPVEIRDTTFGRWIDTILPANDELLRHVRSLSYNHRQCSAGGPGWRPAEGRVNVLRDYLPPFHYHKGHSLETGREEGHRYGEGVGCHINILLYIPSRGNLQVAVVLWLWEPRSNRETL